MRKAMTTGGVALAMLLAAQAHAQCAGNLLTNPSFEMEEPDDPFSPMGWKDIPFTALEWAFGTARTGDFSIGIGSSYPGAFGGWSTDKFDSNGFLYNPAYVHQGGDLTVSGYFMIPTGQELAPGGTGAPLDVVGVKLELRRANFSIYQAFEFPITLSGTQGEWVPFEFVLDDASVTNDFPPFAVAVTILPFRFDLGNGQQGTIYFDDLCVLQGEETCLADLTGDGEVDSGDLALFITAFLAGDANVADLTDDGQVDSGDLALFIQLFLAGC
jgi:hypothetical protein